MEIQISINDLEGMRGQNGLAFLDCAVPAEELLDLINQTFAHSGILSGGKKFENVLSLQHDGAVDLLIPFHDVKVDSTKLVIWQMLTYQNCHGIFLSDYIRRTLDRIDIPQDQWTKPLPSQRKKNHKKAKDFYERS